MGDPVAGLAELRPEDRAAWSEAVEAWESGLRPVAVERSTHVVGAVGAYPAPQRQAFVEALLVAWVDAADGAPSPLLRPPVSSRLLLPALVAGARADEPAALRRLSILLDRGFVTPEQRAALPAGLRDPDVLLERVLALTPDDPVVARRRVASLLWQIEHDLHELPYTLLRPQPEIEADITRAEALLGLLDDAADPERRLAVAREKLARASGSG